MKRQLCIVLAPIYYIYILNIEWTKLKMAICT